jgi:hypothetical protein
MAPFQSQAIVDAPHLGIHLAANSYTLMLIGGIQTVDGAAPKALSAMSTTTLRDTSRPAGPRAPVSVGLMSGPVIRHNLPAPNSAPLIFNPNSWLD